MRGFKRVAAGGLAGVLFAGLLWVGVGAPAAAEAIERPLNGTPLSAMNVENSGHLVTLQEAKHPKATIADGLYLICSASNPSGAISIANDSKQAGAAAAICSRDKTNWAQKWAVTQNSNTGYYRIRNLNSRKFLSVSGTAKSGVEIKQANASKSKAQLWDIVKTSGGYLFRAAGTKLALTFADSKGTPALTLDKARSGRTAQLFKLKSVDALETDQTYYLTNMETGQRLHVADNSRSAGTKIDMADIAADKSQKFRVLRAGSSYRLQNVRSCYYVGTSASGSGGAYQFSKQHGSRTRWAIDLDLENAAFTLKSCISGKRLAASAGNVRLKRQSNAGSQLFTFSKTYAFKLYLNPGHGWNSNNNGVWDPGASGNGHQEAEFSHDLCRRVEKLLASSDIKVINGEKYRLAFWRRMPKAVRMGCDAIVSVHFDVGGGSGTLKMVGVQGRARGSDALANYIDEGVVSHLGLPSRGRSTRSDITCVNGPIPSMLTEICFMDNQNDVRTYLKKRPAVAKGLAWGITKASRSRRVIR